MNEGSRTDVCPPPSKNRSEMSDRELMLEILEGQDADRALLHRVTQHVAMCSRALEMILRKRGNDDRELAEELRAERIALHPPFTLEDAVAPTPTGFPRGGQ